MNSKNTGKQYEELVHQVYLMLASTAIDAVVRKDVKIETEFGSRQIDVTIEHKIAGSNYLTAIECRDYSTALDITHVDAFCSKLRDVGASKGIMVSRNGFTRNARQKAERNQIDLFIADQVSTINQNFATDVTFQLIEIKVLNVGMCWRAGASNQADVKLENSINGVSYEVIINNAFQRNLVKEAGSRKDLLELMQEPRSLVRKFGARIDLAEYFEDELVRLEDSNGTLHVVGDPALLLNFEVSGFFGKLRDLPDATQMTNIVNRQTYFILPNLLSASITKIFKRYRAPNEIPDYITENSIRILSVQTIPVASTINVEVWRPGVEL